MRYIAGKAALAAATLLLAACQNAAEPSGKVSPTLLRAGSWTQTEAMSQEDVIARLNTIEEGRWTLEVAGAPKCGVDVYHYEYKTIDGRGDPVTASSALMVPRGDGDTCHAPNPIVIGLHGTMPDKVYNQADLTGKNPGSNRAIAWAGVYAAQGYIVVAPNYTGLDSSTADHQSYLDAKQQTQDILDALAAARDLLPTVSARASDKLFVVGYSQGGWATMALHREMEKRGMALTASMPMSGPYGMTTIVDDIFRGRVVQGSTIYFPLAIRAMQVAYGDVYDVPGDVYADAYAGTVATLFPSDTPHHELIRDGQLPATALFNDRPVAPAAMSDLTRSALTEGTPATTPERFAAIFAQGFGPDHLISDAYRLAYLEDIAANPDGAWPDYTNGAPPARSGNGLRRAMIKNDLRGWTPKNPLIMCGGQGDGAALMQYGGDLMMTYWSDPAHAPKAGIVSLLDFDAPIMPGDQFAEIKSDYLARKDAILSQYANVPNWVNTYHQLLLPRYCYTAARDYFETLR